MRVSGFSAFIFAALVPLVSANAQRTNEAAARSFNPYVLKAVEALARDWGGKGYDINGVLTHDSPYGSKTIKATSYAPKAMCVSAQLEIILTAINIYAVETGDQTVFDFLPDRSWNSQTNKTIRGHIWVNGAIPSYGTANALKNFGMGEHTQFGELRAGSFVNFNRDNPNAEPGKRYSGHAVTFLGYLDAEGKDVAVYDEKAVVGFKYFSSNGYNTTSPNPTHGFGYRYAFFTKAGKKYCPVLGGGRLRDCDLVWPAKPTDLRNLNTGYMLNPEHWTKTDYSLKGYGLPGEELNILFDNNYLSGRGTDD